MTAALYVYAKFLIQTKRVNQGLKSFKEAIITSKYDVDLIHKSIRFLITENYPRDADQFLKLYPPEKKHLPEFVILDLLISFHNESPEFFIQKAKNRFNEGLESSEITYHYALALNKIGNRVELESVVYEGIEKYPDIAQKLKGLL